MYYDSTFKLQIYGKLNIDIDIEKEIFLASTISLKNTNIPIKIPTFLRNKP